MKFHFALETLLRIRRIREDHQRALLLAANAQEERLRQQLAILEQVHSERAYIVSRQASEGVLAAELQFDSDCRAQAEILHRLMQAELQKATVRAQRELDKYLAQRRDRRAIEVLREQQRQRFEREEQRKEQLVLDEIYLQGRSRTERGQNLPTS